MDFKDFQADPARIDAACWCIACIGEAAGRARNMEPALGDLESGFDLANAYAMRNRLSHGYYSLDEAIIWSAAVNRVPALVKAARAKLAE